MIARCYLRVSTEDQAKEGYSLGAQRDRLAAFAASQGWKVAEYYTDDGASAKDMNRPAFGRLMKEIQKGEVVLVYKLDRLTRNVGDLDFLLRKWESEGILFRSCTEDFNTTTAAGRLFIRLVADLAQWERENLAERTRMGMARRAQEGEWNGGRPPFGYTSVETGFRAGQKVRRLLVPDGNAPVVRELYERYVAGQGMRALALWLNREKAIKSPRGGRWSDASISGILKNPIYCGLTAWDWGGKNGPRNPEAMVSKGRHEAIVSPDLWEQAQQTRRTRRGMAPRHTTGVNILTGVGRCGLCGSYIKVTRQNRNMELRYYRCGSYAAKGSCSLAAVPADAVETHFSVQACSLVASLATSKRVRSMLTSYVVEMQDGSNRLSTDEIRKQAARARQAIAAWDGALEQGCIDLATWQEKTAAHFTRLKDLETEAKAVQRSTGASVMLDSVVHRLGDFRSLWGAATPAERKTLAISLCQAVRIFPDRRVQLVPRVPEPGDCDLPSEVQTGLRLCVKIAVRAAR